MIDEWLSYFSCEIKPENVSSFFTKLKTIFLEYVITRQKILLKLVILKTIEHLNYSKK